MKEPGSICRLFLLAGSLLCPHAVLHADGGTVRLSVRKGDYQITVFTSPAPLRAGPVDVSVLVQDAASGEPVSQVPILVRLSPHGRPESATSQPATTESATNKLFRAAEFDLPEPGLWDVEILIEDRQGLIEVRFEMEAAEPLPHFGEMVLWIAWPAAAILLFGVHQALVWRRAKRRPGMGVDGTS